MDADRISFLAILSINAHFPPESPPLPISDDGNTNRLNIILFCITPKTRIEIFNKIGVTNQSNNYSRFVQPLVESGYLELSLPEKPTSKFQRYQTTEAGKELLG